MPITACSFLFLLSWPRKNLLINILLLQTIADHSLVGARGSLAWQLLSRQPVLVCAAVLVAPEKLVAVGGALGARQLRFVHLSPERFLTGALQASRFQGLHRSNERWTVGKLQRQLLPSLPTRVRIPPNHEHRRLLAWRNLLLVRGKSFTLWFTECSQGKVEGLRGAILT
jgi:pimeloyl-ACP methyl ester carboxylesterase